MYPQKHTHHQHYYHRRDHSMTMCSKQATLHHKN